MVSQAFEILNQPIAVGNLVLKHRMTMAPMGNRLCAEDGHVTQRLIDYYLARARGGAALIMTQITKVNGRFEIIQQARLDHDKYIPSMKELAHAVHAEGVPILVQLQHGGPNDTPPVSPSGLPCMTQYHGIVTSKAMRLEDIEEMRDCFIDAGWRAKQAGFDGVELSGVANYLLEQFFSPRMNKRTDRYGGSLQKRMTLALEIVRGIRQKCGPHFLIGYGMMADELMPSGIVLEQSLPFALALEQEGVDFIDVRVGHHETFVTSEKGTGHSKLQSRLGIWDYAEQFKRSLKVPVICATQGCYDPLLWEEALKKGQTDVIQIAKPFLADSELPRKVLEEKFAEIRPCVLCLNCLDPEKGQIADCAINPETGREEEYAIRSVDQPKKVLVVGGGPGGLEAARIASLRGHAVTLAEKGRALGGNLSLLGCCAGNDLYHRFRDWLIGQCTAAGVTFKLDTEVTPQLVNHMQPDTVIVATGAKENIIPDIDGIKELNVVTPEEVLNAEIVLGKRVVVLGGGLIGVDMAYTIAAENFDVQVTILEPKEVPELARDMSFLNRTYMTMVLLPKLGLEWYTGVRIEKINSKNVVIVDREGKKRKIKADSVVNALGYQPDETLYRKLKTEDWEVYAIGDCVKAGKVADAVYDGARIARRI
jgi:2,4-dienoyl-CoA reductase-like NADH-dependent reductase (Old Yellow Enzyme family)/thioredoxin reductase